MHKNIRSYYSLISTSTTHSHLPHLQQYPSSLLTHIYPHIAVAAALDEGEPDDDQDDDDADDDKEEGTGAGDDALEGTLASYLGLIHNQGTTVNL